MIGKNGRDVPITKITADNFLCPENEQNVFHVLIEQRKFSDATGERLSKPRIQKYGVKSWAQSQPHLKRQGYTTAILYDPTEWLKDNANAAKPAAEKELKQAQITEAVEAAKKAMQNDIQAQIDAAVKAAIAAAELVKAAKSTTDKI